MLLTFCRMLYTARRNLGEPREYFNIDEVARLMYNYQIVPEYLSFASLSADWAVDITQRFCAVLNNSSNPWFQRSSEPTVYSPHIVCFQLCYRLFCPEELNDPEPGMRGMRRAFQIGSVAVHTQVYAGNPRALSVLAAPMSILECLLSKLKQGSQGHQGKTVIFPDGPGFPKDLATHLLLCSTASEGWDKQIGFISTRLKEFIKVGAQYPSILVN